MPSGLFQLSIWTGLIAVLGVSGVLLRLIWIYIVCQCIFYEPLGINIMKTRLYSFYPLKPHFYTVKLGFAWVYINFLISAQKIDCGYSLEHLAEAVLTSTHNLYFEQKYEKYQNFNLKTSIFLYLNRCVFVMTSYYKNW